MAFTKNKFLKVFTLAVISFQLVFSGIASAQQIQMVPVSPQSQTTISGQQTVSPAQQPQTVQPTSTQPPPGSFLPKNLQSLSSLFQGR